MYGRELIIDLHQCDTSKFNRQDMKKYIIELCDDVINMERADLHWWDYEGDLEEKEKAPAHLKGTSCVQFITTSTIVIHTLDDMEDVYINIFSCKDFDSEKVIEFTIKFFNSWSWKSNIVTRG